MERRFQNFSIVQICDSGQCFRMEPRGGHTWQLVAKDRYLEVAQEGDKCCFSCEEEEFSGFWEEYFDLKRDYGSCIDRINPGDRYLTQAAEFGSGIRILRQDLWEMIVSFLISQQNNIGRIRRCIRNLCEQYGERKQNFRGEVYYAFPKPEVLAELPEEALKECNLGYRSRYVVRTARAVCDGKNCCSFLAWGIRWLTVSVCLPCIIWRLFPWILISARRWSFIIREDFLHEGTEGCRESCSSTFFIMN